MTTTWGIIATGNIAGAFAAALQQSDKNTLSAVASRDHARAVQFARQFGLHKGQAYGDYDALISHSGVDAVYVATPHSDHAQWVLKALGQGTAVLCEKPMGLNHAEVMAMVACAKEHGSFLMEAFMYQLHPQTQKALSLVGDGTIGQVRHIHAQFGYHAPYDAKSRLFANQLAGGGIMDVGCYPLSFARHIFGHEPTTLTAHGHIGNSQVDEWSAALLSFEHGASAQISTSVSLSLTNDATIYGSKGHIHITQPWQPGGKDGTWQFELTSNGKTEQISGNSEPIYVIEADHVADCLAQGIHQSPIITWQDSLANALQLDHWREQIGLVYASERPDKHEGVLWQVATAKQSSPAQPTTAIGHGQVPGLEKSVARLIMGCDNQPSMPHAATMWDDYFLRGGNCFDTAHIYGGGSMEALLGQWHTRREIREDMVIVGKGAHSPNNFPEHISHELDISLDRLQTDYVDIYFLHRDNPDIPVDEFVDALNAEVSRGRIRVFGGSNWTLPRVKQANEYAKAHALQQFSAVSNNFSLARMVERIWPGVESIDSQEYLDYLTATGIALLPWSSQARGFFTPWADQAIADAASENPIVTSMQPTLAELKRTWFSPDNFQRRENARVLADKYGVDMINIALAYVLNQPFPTFALIGPRVLAETASCIDGLNLELSEDELSSLVNGGGAG